MGEASTSKKPPQKLRARNCYNLFVRDFFKSPGKYLSILYTNGHVSFHLSKVCKHTCIFYMDYTNVFRGIVERSYFLSFYVGEGEREALSVEGSYIPSSSVSVFVRGGEGSAIEI